MKPDTPLPRHLGLPPTRQSQTGMALIFSLLVLVALMLASVAMVRVVSSGSHIAGNLAFQQDALMVSERATQVAIDNLFNALASNTDALNQSDGSAGFYASPPASLDATGNALEGNNARALIQWDDSYCNTFDRQSFVSCTHMPNRDVLAINGNRASYIVFRLCNAAGALSEAAMQCASAGAAANQAGAQLTGNECQGAINYENPGHCLQQSIDSSVLYRIVVRTVGPRNTVSFTETLVNL